MDDYQLTSSIQMEPAIEIFDLRSKWRVEKGGGWRQIGGEVERWIHQILMSWTNRISRQDISIVVLCWAGWKLSMLWRTWWYTGGLHLVLAQCETYYSPAHCSLPRLHLCQLDFKTNIFYADLSIHPEIPRQTALGLNIINKIEKHPHICLHNSAEWQKLI